MRRRLFPLDEKLFRYKRAYLVQSLIAAGYILVIYFFLDVLREGWAIAPLAASTFIAFSFPNVASSRPRYLLGGYFVAVVTGTLFSKLNVVCAGAGVPVPQVLCCGAAMLVTMLLMACFDFEHPPAAAMAITLVLTPDETLTLGTVAFLCIAALSGLKEAVKARLKNL